MSKGISAAKSSTGGASASDYSEHATQVKITIFLLCGKLRNKRSPNYSGAAGISEAEVGIAAGCSRCGGGAAYDKMGSQLRIGMGFRIFATRLISTLAEVAGRTEDGISADDFRSTGASLDNSNGTQDRTRICLFLDNIQKQKSSEIPPSYRNLRRRHNR